MAFSCRSSFSLYLFLFALCSVLLRCASSSSSAASSPVADVRFKVFLDWLSENGAELTLLDAVEIKKSLTKGYSFVSRSAIEVCGCGCGCGCVLLSRDERSSLISRITPFCCTVQGCVENNENIMYHHHYHHF